MLALLCTCIRFIHDVGNEKQRLDVSTEEHVKNGAKFTVLDASFFAQNTNDKKSDVFNFLITPKLNLKCANFLSQSQGHLLVQILHSLALKNSQVHNIK